MKKSFFRAVILICVVFSFNCYAEDKLNLEKYTIYTKDKETVEGSCSEYTDTTFKEKYFKTGLMYEKSRETENYVGTQSIYGDYSFKSDDYKLADLNLNSFNRFYKKNMFIGIELGMGANRSSSESNIYTYSRKEIMGEGMISLGNGRIYNYEHWYIANIILEAIYKKNLINRELTEEEKVMLAQKINEYKEREKIGTTVIEKYLSDIGVYDKSDLEKSSEIKKIISILSDREYEIKNGKIVYLRYAHMNSFDVENIEDGLTNDEDKNSYHADAVSIYGEVSKIISQNRINSIKLESAKSLNETNYNTEIEAGTKLLLNANNSIEGNISYEYTKYGDYKGDKVDGNIKVEQYIYNNIKVIPTFSLSKHLKTGEDIVATTGIKVSADIKINENFKVASNVGISKNLNIGTYSDLATEFSCSYRVDDLEVVPSVKMNKSITTGEDPDLVLGILCSYQLK